MTSSITRHRLREQFRRLEPAHRRCCQPSSSSGRWPRAMAAGSLTLGDLVVYAQCAVGTSLIRVRRLELGAAGRGAAPGGWPVLTAWSRRCSRQAHLAAGGRSAGTSPERDIRFKQVTFSYPGWKSRARRGSISRYPPPAHRSPSSDRTAPEKTTLAKAAVPAVRPAIGRDLKWTALGHPASSTWPRGRSRLDGGLPGLHQVSSVRCATTSRRPALLTRRSARRSRESWARRTWRKLDTILAKGYEGWHRFSPADSGSAWRWRARSALVEMGAGLVLLDEPTAQLERARRGRDLRTYPRGHAEGDDDSDLASLLDRPARRSDLRPRTRKGHRARHPRRA